MLIPIALTRLQVNSEGYNDENLSTVNPYVYVSSYEIVSGNTNVGQSFTMRIHVENAHSDIDAQNIMLSLYFSDEVFYLPKGGTNQYYIESLEAGKSTYIDIDFEVKNEFATDWVVMDFDFKYLSDLLVEYENSTQIRVRQFETTQLEVKFNDFSDSAIANVSSNFQIECQNTGMTQIDRILISLEGEFAESPKVIEYKSLGHGETAIIDVGLSFVEFGERVVSMTVNYEDEYSQSFSSAGYEYEINVIEEPDNAYEVEISTNPTANVFEGNNFWVYISIATIVLIGMIIIVFAIKLLLRGRQRK